MNGSIMKIAGEEALRQNIIKTKEYVQQHGGGGHTIITASSLPMAGQPNLQFEGVHVENVGQAGQGKTVIKPQFHVCATEAEWNQMTDAEKNDPLIYWVRPWASSDAFASDRTPVGTVVSVGAAKTGEATGVSTPTGRFPTDDYLVCDGSTYITVDGKTVYICQQNFPKLYDYFVEAYGTATYFGSGRGQQGDFSLPNWTADFPENGILCIKAQISSTAITFAEIDDTGIYAGEDKVPSCARVAEIENKLKNVSYTQPTNLVGGGGTITIYKQNRLCILVLQGIFKNISASTYTKICNLPSEYIPFSGFYQDSYSYFTSDTNYIIHVASDGVSIRKGGTATGNIGVYTNIPYISNS